MPREKQPLTRYNKKKKELYIDLKTLWRNPDTIKSVKKELKKFK